MHNARPWRLTAGFPSAAGVLVIALSACVLLGWQFHVELLKLPFPQGTYMAPNTALCLMLCGVSLWLQRKAQASSAGVFIARLAACFVFVFSLLTLLEWVGGFDFHIDNVFFRHRLDDWKLADTPGRFALSTAIAFPMFGLALLLLDKRVGRQAVSELLALCGGLVPFVGFIGYLYRVSSLYRLGTSTSMALPTAATFVLLAVGIVFARSEHRIAAQVISGGVGGVLARRLLLASFVTIGLFGWLSVRALGQGIVAPDFGVALLVTGSIVVLFVMVTLTARKLENQEEALRRNREWLRVTLHSIGDAVLATDTSSRITFLNPVAAALTGWTAEEANGQPIQTVFRMVNEETRVTSGDLVARVLTEGRILELANHTSLIARDGREIPIEDSAAPILGDDGAVAGAVLVFHDVTEKRRRDEQLGRLNRTLHALSNCNLALVHATDEAALLEEACRIVTEDCGHAMVWIGYAEIDANKTVRPVAHSGFDEGYLDTLQITWADDERGRGPTGMAIRTGQASSCRNMLTDPRFAPWRAEAQKRGYSSSLVLPLKQEGKAFAAVTIYSRRPEAFASEEVELLEELAGNLSFGIGALRARAAKEKAEEALRQSQEWLRVTLSSIGDAVLTTDTQGRVTFQNPVAMALTGWKQEEARGEPVESVFRIINEQTRVTAEDVVARVLREGHVVELANHTALIARDGREIPVEDSAAPIRDSAGQVIGVVLVFHDVTEKRRASEALQQSETRFRLALRNAPVSVAAQGPDLTYIWAYNQRTGPPGGVLGMRDADIFTPEETSHITEIKERVLREGVELREQMWFKRPGGPIFLDVSYSPIRDSAGAITGVGCATVDLTPLKQAEEKLRVSEEKFAKAFAGNPAAVALTRLNDGLFLEVNDTWVALLGHTREQAIGHSAREMKIWANPEDAARFVKELGDKGWLRGWQQQFLKKTGEAFIAELSAQLLTIGGEQIILSTLVDITSRKRAEAALLRSEKLASVGRMAASIAHEINNPLEAVTNILYLARTSPDVSATVQRYLEMADDELGRITHITRQTLGFYRETATPTTVSIGSVLNSAVDLLRGKIKVRGARVEQECESEVTVTAIAGELRQVFSNLLANSLDALPYNGAIKVRVSMRNAGEPQVRVTIADNGSGISADALPHIFEPLFTTKEGTGAGLGLWVSKQIVEKHQGSIRIRSRSNGDSRGTVVSVTLPAAATDANGQASGLAASEARKTIG